MAKKIFIKNFNNHKFFEIFRKDKKNTQNHFETLKINKKKR